jgi:hypothetical protein
VAWLPEVNAAMTAFSTSRPKSRARLFCKSQSSETRQLIKKYIYRLR